MRAAAAGGHQDPLRLRRRGLAQLLENGQDAAGQADLPVRQDKPLLLQVHLVPPQRRDLLHLEPQLPGEPQGRPGGGILFRLQQLPEGELVDLRRRLPADAGGDLLLRQIGREVDVHGGGLQPGDPGDVLPVVMLQLPQNVVVAQVDQADRLQAPGVQRGAGQAGDGLGRQGLLVPVRQHHPFAAAVPLPAQGLQPGGQLRVQRDRPVRQQELLAQQIHLGPGEVLDFVPHQTGHPRQPQDGTRGIICMLFQHPAEQGSIGAVKRVTLHSVSSFCYTCVSQK